MGRGLDGSFDTRCGDCAVLKDRERRGLSPFSGGFSEGETPLPIPNRAVKPLSADGTWLARAWESRTPPVFRAIGRFRAAYRRSRRPARPEALSCRRRAPVLLAPASAFAMCAAGVTHGRDADVPRGLGSAGT